MNKIYKTIRNHKNGLMVVVSELAKGNKKSLTGKLLALAVSTTLLTTTTAMATTTTIYVTENNQVISNHYDSTSGDQLKINFKDPNYTLIFKDISTTGAIKSTDNNITLQVNGDPLKAGGNLIFQNNTNKNNGGAIGGSILNLSSLNSISFIKNISGNDGGIGLGGGVYSYSSSDSSSDSSVTLGGGAYFSGNRAGNGSSTTITGVSFGGAIYSTHNVSLNGNTFFVGNLVGKGSASQGGAIYLDGKSNALGTQNTATLNTNAGAIAFKNNYVNVEKDATGGRKQFHLFK